MRSYRRTVTVVAAAVVTIGLAGPVTTAARGSTSHGHTATTAEVSHGSGERPTLTPAEQAFQADVVRGTVPQLSRPLVADTGPQTFTVNSSGDQPDANVGDGVCAVDQSDGGGCTLRAAIQEADTTADKDTINIDVASIAPASSLPPLTQPVIINGGSASSTELTGSSDSTDLTPGLVIEGGNSTLENITINDFDNVGVLLSGVGSDMVIGCHIGTNPAGDEAAPNGTFTSASAGLEIENTDSVVGGPDAGDRNTISGNNGDGVFIASGADRTLVEGNTVGLDATGTSSIPNRIGVLVTYYTGTSPSTEAKNVVVGGPDPADGNLISGNSKPADSTSTLNYIGLDVLDNGTTITNNEIGLNIDGEPAGNGIGVWLSNVANAVLGKAGAGNTIVASQSDGVRLDGIGDTGDVIQANDIGTYADADSDVGNGFAGIDYYFSSSESQSQGPSSVTIGGADAGLGNVISGNKGPGIRVAGPGANIIQGNKIGTDVDGTTSLRNGQDAVQLTSTANNTIGGTLAGDGNVISAPSWAGVFLLGAGTKANEVSGNFIGTDSAGDELGVGTGVSFQQGASGNIVGYAVSDTPDVGCTSACNTIADATGDGVELDGTEHQDTIRGNSIYNIKELPIAFRDKANGETEPLPNDETDADKGSNDELNFPAGVMATKQADNSALPGGGGTIVTGTLSPAPATTTAETVDIYGLTATDDVTDPQPAGQVDSWGDARAWLGAATVQPDGTFWMPLTANDAATYESFSATATDSAGNTSEVSPVCMPIDHNTSDDADDDGICDEWETKGLDFDGNGTSDLNLKAYGASPTRRDLFAEVDYFVGFPVQRQALELMQRAFAKSPVSAPNDPSSTGIDLHFGATEDKTLLTDDAITPTASEQALTKDQLINIRDGSPTNACDGHFGSAADRASKNCWEILGAKHLIWRYVLFADHIGSDDRLAGEGDISGRTVVVALGGALSTPADPLALNMPRSVAVAGGWPTVCDSRDTCLAQTQAAVLMHEFGHNLGLHHGGDSDTNYKPNYLSIMNYNLSYNNVVPGRPLDYSRVQLPDLNESALLETKPIVGGVPPAKIGAWTKTAYQSPIHDAHGNVIPGTCIVRAVSIFGPVSWNGDLTIQSTPFAASESSDDNGSYTCSNPPARVLTGFDDWDNLQYTPVPVFYNTWAWAGPPTTSHAAAATSTEAEPDINLWQQAMNADADGDGVPNATDDCPSVADATQAPSSVKGIGKACIGLITQRDLSVAMKVSGKAKRGKTLHITVSLHDGYPLAATGDVVSFKVPHGLKLKSTKASTGKYAKSSGKWTIKKVGGLKTVTLKLVVKVTGKLPVTATAELIKAGQKDPNSTPNNHNIYEDDEARHVI